MLPSPVTKAERGRHGYRYSVRQLELSDTRVFDRPPVIQAHCKHSKVKQYFKEGRALRTETTVNDPYDLGVKRTLSAETWQQLRQVGDQTNDRLHDAQLQACSCAPDPSTLQRLVSPSIEDGQPAPVLHFGDPRVMALFSCLCCFQHLFPGLGGSGLLRRSRRRS